MLNLDNLKAKPAGSDTQVQFNDSGLFGGDAGFTYNKTTDTATLVGGLTSPLVLGSTASGGDLTLRSTSHATKGQVYFGESNTTYFNEPTEDFYFGANVYLLEGQQVTCNYFETPNVTDAYTIYLNSVSTGVPNSVLTPAVEVASGIYTQSSGTYVGLKVAPRYTQTGTAGATDFLINRVQTSVGSGPQMLIDAQVSGSSKCFVRNDGYTVIAGAFSCGDNTVYCGGVTHNNDTDTSLNFGTNSLSFYAGGVYLSQYDGSTFSAPTTTVYLLKNPTYTNTTGPVVGVSVTPTYNQASGTSANTDFLINRTQTAVGSGTQYLIDAQADSASKFSVNNVGAGVLATSLQTPFITGSTAANGDLEIYGTTHATLTTSYIFMHPTGTANAGYVVIGDKTSPTLSASQKFQVLSSNATRHIGMFGTGVGEAFFESSCDFGVNPVFRMNATSTSDTFVLQDNGTDRVNFKDDGKLVTNGRMIAATGNEVAYTFGYTTNKLTSGNDTGFLISMTDTASPGTSLPLDIQVGAASKCSVDNSGIIQSKGFSRVSTQFDKTNDSTLANITGLTATVGGSKVYKFKAILFVDANVTAGHQYAISGTATQNATIYQVNSISNATNLYVINSRQTTLGGAVGQAGATGVYTEITGLINVATAGTLTVQFAQNVATPATTSSVLVGSNFEVFEVL